MSREQGPMDTWWLHIAMDGALCLLTWVGVRYAAELASRSLMTAVGVLLLTVCFAGS